MEPAASDNAEPLYAEAFAALAATDGASPSYLADNRKALGLLHAASARKLCRYPIDLTKGYATLLPHLSKLKKAAQLLGKAVTEQAAQGHPEASTDAVLDGLALARSLETEPVLMSQLVRINAEASVLTGLESALDRKAFPDEQLLRLHDAFRGTDDGVSLTRALAGKDARPRPLRMARRKVGPDCTRVRG